MPILEYSILWEYFSFWSVCELVARYITMINMTNPVAASQQPSPRVRKPKEYPNSNDMMGRFLQAGGVWVRHVNNSRRRQMQRTVGGTLQKTFSEATAICPKNCRWLGHQCREQLQQHSKEPFGSRKKTNVSFRPRPSLWLKTPKLTLLGKKLFRELKWTKRIHEKETTNWSSWWQLAPNSPK